MGPATTMVLFGFFLYKASPEGACQYPVGPSTASCSGWRTCPHGVRRFGLAAELPRPNSLFRCSSRLARVRGSRSRLASSDIGTMPAPAMSNTLGHILPLMARKRTQHKILRWMEIVEVWRVPSHSH